MRAARIVAPGRLEVEELPEPEPGDGQVRIRTVLAAICGSDLHQVFDSNSESFPGPPGFPGHESVGVVTDSNSASFAPGDLVLSLPEGARARAFASVQVVPAHQLLLANGMDPTELLMVQQMGTVIFALKRFWTGAPGQLAAVYGAGAAGLHFVQLLKHRGFEKVVAVDLSRRRLAAAQRLGADAVVDARTDDPVNAIMEISDGRGADLAVEAAGQNQTRTQAMESVAPGGTIGLFGLPAGPENSQFPFGSIFRRQPRIVMSVGAQAEPGLVSFREALARVRQRELRVKELVTETLPFEEIDVAFRLARYDRDRVIKVALELPVD